MLLLTTKFHGNGHAHLLTKCRVISFIFSIGTKINLTSYNFRKNVYRSKNRKVTVKCLDVFSFKSMLSNKLRFSKETHKTSTCTKRYTCGRVTIPPFGRVILVLKSAYLV